MYNTERSHAGESRAGAGSAPPRDTPSLHACTPRLRQTGTCMLRSLRPEGQKLSRLFSFPYCILYTNAGAYANFDSTSRHANPSPLALAAALYIFFPIFARASHRYTVFLFSTSLRIHPVKLMSVLWLWHSIQFIDGACSGISLNYFFTICNGDYCLSTSIIHHNYITLPFASSMPLLKKNKHVKKLLA